MADWTTIASLARAGGTLVPTLATFLSVRSANRASRTAEQALLLGQRPLLMPSRVNDPPEKIMWVDEHWANVEGSRASVEFVDSNIYLAALLRNAGNGIAVLQGWASPDHVQGSYQCPTRTHSGRRRVTSTSRPATWVSGRASETPPTLTTQPFAERSRNAGCSRLNCCTAITRAAKGDRSLRGGAQRRRNRLALVPRAALEPRSAEPALTRDQREETRRLARPRHVGPESQCAGQDSNLRPAA